MEDLQYLLDRRGETRIKYNDLPQELKRFMVIIGHLVPMEVETIDAAMNGISLRIPLSIEKVKTYFIILKALNNSFEINDEIVYIKQIDKDSCRISIKFSSSKGFEEYKKILNRHIDEKIDNYLKNE